MRRVILLAVLALALPTAALANTVDYQNYGTFAAGTASVVGSATAGNTLTLNSALVGINTTQGTLGQVSVSTGTLVSVGGGNFTFTGGSISIWNTSSQSLFHGTFTTGTVSVVNGFTTIQGFVGGVAGTVQIGINLNGRTGVISGDTIVTPEPGTLGLLGTGLVGLAGVIRRKVRG